MVYAKNIPWADARSYLHSTPSGSHSWLRSRNLWRVTFACLLFKASLYVSPAAAQTAEAKPTTTLQGKLLDVPGSGPALKTKGRSYSLSAKSPWLFHTLQDKRLENREVRVEGTLQSDGTLKVSQVYTLRDGKLFRVRYFCEVCNIEALEPGNCVCCQQPTELQEIPVSEK